MEYWCHSTDEIWQAGPEEIKLIAEADLKGCGFIASGNEVSGLEVIRVPKCYPVYDNTYKPHLQTISDFARTFRGLHLIGRYGSFKYNNQDHSILMGLLAAKQIMSNKSQNLWSINTDDEYQEAAASEYNLAD